MSYRERQNRKGGKTGDQLRKLMPEIYGPEPSRQLFPAEAVTVRILGDGYAEVILRQVVDTLLEPTSSPAATARAITDGIAP